MLVLSRKLGQRILISNDIIVTVMNVRGDRVKLGFECPANIPIHREEVYRRVHAEQPARIASRPLSESTFLSEFA